MGRQNLVAMAEPSLQRIVAETGESAYVSVHGPGDTALYVAMVEGTHSVRHAGWVGRTVALKGTAVGSALQRPGSCSGICREAFDGRARRDGDRRPDLAARRHRRSGQPGRPDLPDQRRQVSSFGRIVSREAAAITAQFGSSRVGGRMTTTRFWSRESCGHDQVEVATG